MNRYAVTNLVYDAYNEAFKRAVSRRFALPALATYIARWVERLQADHPGGPRSDDTPSEIAYWHKSPLATLYVYDDNWPICHLFVYADRVVVGQDDAEIGRPEFEYLRKALETTPTDE